MGSENVVVVVTSSFPIRGDGSEAAGSFVADFVAALAERMPVRVVAPGVEVARERWSERIEVVRYLAPGVPLSTLKAWNPRHLAWILKVLRGGSAATREATEGAHHILALWGLPCGAWARQAARERDLPYSVWLLGSDVWSLGRVPVLRGLLGRVIRDAAHVYADGYRLAEDARKIGGVEVGFLPSTRSVGSNNVPPPRGAPPYRLLFLGRWHPNKGVDVLLDALDLLADDDWARVERVEIQGGGPMDELVRARASALASRGRPVEAGRFLSKSEAEAVIARSDWLLIPSRIESIPVVFSDAMKLGRPVVSTPVGDLPRLLTDHSVGVCARDTSAPAFAEALHAALQLSAGGRSEALARAARPFSLEHSIVPQVVAGMEGISMREGCA